MKPMIRLVDKKGRITLPGFANAIVILESISTYEYRIRRAQVIPEEDLIFTEEKGPFRLSKEAARNFLEVLDHPPSPNAAARRAAKRFKKKHG